MRADFIAVMKEMTQTQKDNVYAQRVTICLIATEQKERQAKLATCERLAR